MFKSFIDRFNLDEPSTYASLAVGAVSVGIAVPEPIIASGSLIVSGIFSLLGWFLKEKGKAPKRR